MRAGDVFHSPNGHQWIIFSVLTLAGVVGLEDGRYMFILRPIPTQYGDDVLCALLPLEAPGWTTETVIDKRDVYELAGEQFAIHGERGNFIKLRREDRTTEWTLRWRVAFCMLRGKDVSPEAEWRDALPEEI